MIKGQLHKLELVYPPISNQEAEWLKNDPDVQKELQDSNLYLIGQKPESFFTFYESIEKDLRRTKKIQFLYNFLDKNSEVEIDIPKLLDLYELTKKRIDDIECEMGDTFIRLWLHNSNDKQILDWFTTEKLIVDRSREKPGINKFELYSEFSKYYLHYVGISKKDDSLTRLVIKPHDKRLRILSSENPFYPQSRLTDEIILFFFRIHTLRINQYEFHEYEELIANQKVDYDDKIRIVSDAEKAFINILNTNYNTVKYDEYPFSKDGLYQDKIDRYGYFLGEEITFITDNNYIIGEYTPYEFGLKNKADFIFIEGEKVELVRISEIINA